jgi:hypothetical protein
VISAKPDDAMLAMLISDIGVLTAQELVCGQPVHRTTPRSGEPPAPLRCLPLPPPLLGDWSKAL